LRGRSRGRARREDAVRLQAGCVERVSRISTGMQAQELVNRQRIFPKLKHGAPYCSSRLRGDFSPSDLEAGAAVRKKKEAGPARPCSHRFVR
jgi:hypothetical protein